mmetsp:Transcript_11954/g.50275  ORF Transcript_11954/g.50275 Transcript_11954/m.50275 type:complete len:303 (+) Transcript_11954:770-1678(+)
MRALARRAARCRCGEVPRRCSRRSASVHLQPLSTLRICKAWRAPAGSRARELARSLARARAHSLCDIVSCCASEAQLQPLRAPLSALCLSEQLADRIVELGDELLDGVATERLQVLVGERGVEFLEAVLHGALERLQAALGIAHLRVAARGVVKRALHFTIARAAVLARRRREAGHGRSRQLKCGLEERQRVGVVATLVQLDACLDSGARGGRTLAAGASRGCSGASGGCGLSGAARLHRRRRVASELEEFARAGRSGCRRRAAAWHGGLGGSLAAGHGGLGSSRGADGGGRRGRAVGTAAA